VTTSVRASRQRAAISTLLDELDEFRSAQELHEELRSGFDGRRTARRLPIPRLKINGLAVQDNQSRGCGSNRNPTRRDAVSVVDGRPWAGCSVRS
jgi:hypothetical protein